VAAAKVMIAVRCYTRAPATFAIIVLVVVVIITGFTLARETIPPLAARFRIIPVRVKARNGRLKRGEIGAMGNYGRRLDAVA